MAKRFPKAVREKAVELRSAGIMPKEIVRRLGDDTAGLGFPVEISHRRVCEYIADHRAKYGPIDVPAPEQIDQDSIQRAKAACVALVMREAVAKERRRKGKLTDKELREVRTAWEVLDRMEALEERAEARRRSKAQAKRGGAPEKTKTETALEKLAREEREKREAAVATERPSSPTSEPQPTFREGQQRLGQLAQLANQNGEAA